jgi:hypothetical protein
MPWIKCVNLANYPSRVRQQSAPTQQISGNWRRRIDGRRNPIVRYPYENSTTNIEEHKSIDVRYLDAWSGGGGWRRAVGGSVTVRRGMVMIRRCACADIDAPVLREAEWAEQCGVRCTARGAVLGGVREDARRRGALQHHGSPRAPGYGPELKQRVFMWTGGCGFRFIVWCQRWASTNPHYYTKS